MERIAFYGGTFDPPHRGHLAIAEALIGQFALDRFVFIPAFHAPHKLRLEPTSAYDRYTMLCLATADNAAITVSRSEIEQPERPYTVETLPRLKEKYPDDQIFFVMGSDSWDEITTWRDWESVLTLCDQIVVTRPGRSIHIDHVTDGIRERIIDIRNGASISSKLDGSHIYFTDAVNIDLSATEIRQKIAAGDTTWQSDVPDVVAKYILKYQIYS